MNTKASDHRTQDERSSQVALLLQNPIDFIAEEHYRLRAVCGELDRLSGSRAAEQVATRALIAYLENELTLILADEAEDLVPAAMARAEPEDEFPKLARRLHKENANILRQLSTVVSGLRASTLKRGLSGPLRDAMRELANASRRHLVLENAILLPLARARLTAEDLDGLRRAMLKRRGLESLLIKQAHGDHTEPKRDKA